MLAVYKREFNSYFNSPIGYIFLSFFCAISGFLFFMFTLSSGYADTSGMFYFMFIVLLVLIPILTMRLFSEDQKLKTDQLLLTSPISLTGLVLGKFLAAFTIYAIGISMMLIYCLVLSAFATVTWAIVWGNIIALLCFGASFIAIGMMMSCLTENQMISAASSFAVMLILILIEFAASAVNIEFIQNVLYSISILSKYSLFTLGIFSIANIIFFISFAVVFIFLTIRILEKRRWN